MLVFEERGKPEYLEKNLSEQGREPTTNPTHTWLRRQDLNLGHIGGRRVLSLTVPFLAPQYVTITPNPNPNTSYSSSLNANHVKSMVIHNPDHYSMSDECTGRLLIIWNRAVAIKLWWPLKPGATFSIIIICHFRLLLKIKVEHSRKNILTMQFNLPSPCAYKMSSCGLLLEFLLWCTSVKKMIFINSHISDLRLRKEGGVLALAIFSSWVVTSMSISLTKVWKYAGLS